MSTHRPGVRLPDQMRERQAAARMGVNPTRDQDTEPYYSSEEACWPEGSMTEEGRHVGVDANPCWGLAIDTFLVTYTCRCGRRFYGTTERSVRAQVLAHQGRAE